MSGNGENVHAAPDLTTPVTIGVEAYISEDYARAERDRLWRKVWQQVGRVEDMPEVGNYLTYDILDDSVMIVRTATDKLRSPPQRLHAPRPAAGRRPGRSQERVRATRKSFVCGFHGWTYDLRRPCTHIPEQDDWQGALTAQNTRLGKVNVDTWGGWIWINMDPDCEPLRDYLEPAATMLDPFELTEHALQVAAMAGFRLQLEGRPGGLQRDLPRCHHAPGVHQIRQLPRLGQSAGPAQQHRLRRAQRPGADAGQDAARRRRRPAQVDCRNAGLHLERDATPTRRRRWSTPRCDWSTSCPKTRPPTEVLEALARPLRVATTKRAAWSGRPSIPRTWRRAAPPGRSSPTSRSATG